MASAIFIFSLPKIPFDPACSFPAPRFFSTCFQTCAFVYRAPRSKLDSSASLIGNDISIFSVVDYRKKLITKNCHDSRQGNLLSLHVFVYENWSDDMSAWLIFVWDTWHFSQLLTSGVFWSGFFFVLSLCRENYFTRFISCYGIWSL